MLRTKVDPQPKLWETIAPRRSFAASRLGFAPSTPVLDDPMFFEPFVPYFDPRFGRPSIPIETYLRLMHLRFRYRLGFETLCAEVTDSLSLAALLPDRSLRQGAGPLHAHEDHQALRRGRGRPAERGAA